MAKIDITARLNAASVDGILASANQIYDENKGKFQTAVNEDLDKRLKEQDGRLERYHDDLVDEVNREVTETIETTQETIDQLKEASEWLKNDPSGAQAIMEQTNQNTANIATIGRNTGIDEYSEFSTGMDYSAGDVVLYDGVLFRFKDDHAAGEWDYNEVEEWSEKKEREEKVGELKQEVDTNFNTLCLALDKILSTKELEMSIVNEEEILPITYINNQGDIVPVGDGNESYFVKKIIVEEGELYQIKANTSPLENSIFALYKDEELLYKEDGHSVIRNENHFIIIPKGANVLYIQQLVHNNPVYKIINFNIVDYLSLINNNTQYCIDNINLLSKFFSYELEQIQPVPEVLQNNYLSSKGNIVYTEDNAYSLLKIPVSKGEIYHISAETSPMINSTYALYKGNTLVSYYNDTTTYKTITALLIPDNVDTLYVQKLNNFGEIKKIKDFTHLTDILHLQESISSLKKIIDSLVVPVLSSPLEIEVSNNKYLNPTTGKPTDISSSYCVGSYLIEAGKQYKVQGQGYQGNCLYSIFDINGNLLLKNFIQKSDTIEETIITAPSDSYIIYMEGIINRPPILNEIESWISNNAENKEWDGKKWVTLGDSLTEFNLRASKNYHDYVAEATGIEVINMGRSGTGYARTRDEGFAFFQRALNIPQDADVITIFGSGNDLGAGLPLGEPTDTSETESLCGYIHRTIDVIQTNFPLIPLGIITPTPWIGLEPSQAPNSMSRYSDAIVAICKIRGVPCFDLYYCSNLHPSNATFRELAYSKDEGNGVHPDENGHKLIAPRFKAFLETLVLSNSVTLKK